MSWKMFIIFSFLVGLKSEMVIMVLHWNIRKRELRGYGLKQFLLSLLGMIETAQVDERAKGNGSSQPGAARRGVQIIDDEPQGQSGGGGCCSSG